MESIRTFAKKYRLIALSFIVGALFVLSPLPASAQLGDLACEGLEQTTSEGCGAGGEAITDVIGSAINILTIAVGIIAVIMIIIAGIRFITGGGDPGSVASARNTVIYSIVGLVIAAIAQIIVRYVVNIV